MRTRKLGDRGGDRVDRILREMRIRDVALYALADQRARQSAAATALEHVAVPFGRRKFADETVVDRLALGWQALDHFRGAIDRRTFLVRCDEQRDRSRRIALREQPLDRHDERGERRFHVGGTAAVQVAVTDRRRERIARPFVQWTGRYDVGVARQADERM